MAAGRGAEVARERRLDARDVEEIFTAFAEAMRELPPDVEAGWLDAQGDLRLAPDIARKLRTARGCGSCCRNSGNGSVAADSAGFRSGGDAVLAEPADLGLGKPQHLGKHDVGMFPE